MSEYIADLVKCNGPNTAATLPIALTRQCLITRDTSAARLSVPAGQLLDAIEAELLESLDDGA